MYSTLIREAITRRWWIAWLFSTVISPGSVGEEDERRDLLRAEVGEDLLERVAERGGRPVGLDRLELLVGARQRERGRGLLVLVLAGVLGRGGGVLVELLHVAEAVPRGVE